MKKTIQATKALIKKITMDTNNPIIILYYTLLTKTNNIDQFGHYSLNNNCQV